MSNLPNTKKIATKMGLFAVGIALLGPAGGTLLTLLGGAVPYVTELVDIIGNRSPEWLVKFAASGSDIFKNFLGERLGDAKSEYNNLKNTKINFHLSRAILEIWVQNFSKIIKFKKTEFNEIDSKIYQIAKQTLIPQNAETHAELEILNLEVDILKSQISLIEVWVEKLKQATKEDNHQLLDDIFGSLKQPKESEIFTDFEIIENEKTAKNLLWTHLKLLFEKWLVENKVDYAQSIWTTDFDEELQVCLFQNLKNDFKEKIVTDANVRDKFFYISFLQIAGLIKQFDHKIELEFDQIQAELTRVHFENSQIKISFSQLFQYLEKQEKLFDSRLMAVFSIIEKLDVLEEFSLDNQPPTKEEVIRYLQRVADEAESHQILLAGKKIEFDLIRQKIEISERKSREPYMAQYYESIRKSQITSRDFRRMYENYDFQNFNTYKAQAKRKIIDWDENTSTKLPRTIILGDPGSGKTWLLCYEARRIALEEIQKLTQEGFELDTIILPIRARLTEVAEFCPKEKDKMNLAEVLAKLASAKGKNLIDEFSSSFQNWIKKRINNQSNCVLLLDALDEVPTETSIGINKQALIDSLYDFSKERKDIRILLTSRIVSFTSVPVFEAREVEILWFEVDQIKNFIKVWFNDDIIKKDKFNQVLAQEPQILMLAQIPLMLALMCRILDFNAGEEFPDTKAKIYKACLNGYLIHWQSIDKHSEVDRSSLKKEIDTLSELAFEFFQKQKDQFRESEFIEQLYQILVDEDKVKEFFNKNENKILIKITAEDDPIMKFLHLTFQEYLTAKYLAKHGWDEFVFKNEILFDPRWSEVLQILGGELDPIQSTAYIDKLISINGENGEGDVFFRPFILSMFTAVNAKGKLSEEYSYQLKSELLNKVFNLPRFLEIKDFLPAIKYWGRELRNNLLPLDKNSDSNLISVLILGEIGNEEDQQLLIDYLLDPDEFIRNIALQSLNNISYEFLSDDIIKLLLDRLLKNNSVTMRRLVANILRISGRKASSDYTINQLIELLSDKDPYICAFAASALGDLGERVAEDFVIEKLIAHLQETTFPNIRTAISRTLYNLRKFIDRKYFSQLIIMLKNDSHTDVKKFGEDFDDFVKNANRSNVSLINNLNKSDIDFIKNLFLNVDKEYRTMDEEQVKGEIEIFKQAISSIEGINNYSIDLSLLDILERNLSHPFSSIRGLTCSAIGVLGKTATKRNFMNMLIAMLKDDFFEVREDAAVAISKLAEHFPINTAVSSLKLALETQMDNEWKRNIVKNSLWGLALREKIPISRWVSS